MWSLTLVKGCESDLQDIIANAVCVLIVDSAVLPLCVSGELNALPFSCTDFTFSSYLKNASDLSYSVRTCQFITETSLNNFVACIAGPMNNKDTY